MTANESTSGAGFERPGECQYCGCDTNGEHEGYCDNCGMPCRLHDSFTDNIATILVAIAAVICLAGIVWLVNK